MNRILSTAFLATVIAVGAAVAADSKPTHVYAPFHKLTYTPEQQAKIAAVQAEYREKIAALEQEMNDKVMSMLTAEQKAEYAKQEDEARKKRAEYAKKYREKKKAEEGDDEKKDAEDKPAETK
ncbi:MAG: hypothetical protein GC159_23465 [Phycisphaera sp.]|nr:hypothetical protein [Phycisphaera sp.]